MRRNLSLQIAVKSPTGGKKHVFPITLGSRANATPQQLTRVADIAN
jgi:hypothetical protein